MNRTSADILVQLADPLRADEIGLTYHLEKLGHLIGAPTWVLFRAGDTREALAAEQRLRLDGRVLASSDNRALGIKPCQAFVPNDPYFPYNSPTGFLGQWHLVPSQANRPNVGIQLPWGLGLRGAKSRIGILDSGVDILHPDLAPAFDANTSYDFFAGDSDPSPVAEFDSHGTLVAGIALARGGNGIGVTGVAPNASLAALRFSENFQSRVDSIVNSILFKSSGDVSNRLIHIKCHGYGIAGLGIYGNNDAIKTALHDSTLAGTIHVVSAGNDGLSHYVYDNGFWPYMTADTGMHLLAGNPDAIAVSALGCEGYYGSSDLAPYSNSGANISVCAPGGDETRDQNYQAPAIGLTTTDRRGGSGWNGNYDTDQFPDQDYSTEYYGTSAAAAIVSGCLALVKEKCPTLNTRMAKHLFARTSTMNNARDGEWRRNSAGIYFNRKFGFGTINTDRMISESRRYYSTTPQTTLSTGTKSVGVTLPDLGLGVTRSFYIGNTAPLEEVRVRIRATHSNNVGQIVVSLTSPYGIKSQLTSNTWSEPVDATHLDWWFSSNAFWGENAKGIWTITVLDADDGWYQESTGVWQDYAVEFRQGGLVSKLGSSVLSSNGSAMKLTSFAGSSFLATTDLGNLNAGFTAKATGDIDANGRNDILSFNATTRALQGHLLYDLVPRGVKAMGSLPAGVSPFALADLDQDGRQDVVVFNSNTKEIGYFRLTGNGSLSTYAACGIAPAGMTPKAAVDSTGDGQPDIILDRGTSPRAILVWQLLPGGTPYGFLFSGYQVAGYDLLNAGDVNFDGQPDFLARNTTSNVAAVYTMNILSVTTVSSLYSPPSGFNAVGLVAL